MNVAVPSSAFICLLVELWFIFLAFASPARSAVRSYETFFRLERTSLFVISFAVCSHRALLSIKPAPHAFTLSPNELKADPAGLDGSNHLISLDSLCCSL